MARVAFCKNGSFRRINLGCILIDRNIRKTPAAFQLRLTALDMLNTCESRTCSVAPVDRVDPRVEGIPMNTRPSHWRVSTNRMYVSMNPPAAHRYHSNPRNIHCIETILLFLFVINFPYPLFFLNHHRL